MSDKQRQIASMTGFGHARRTIAGATIEVDVRSVNARYLDLTLKTAEEFRTAEPWIRERVAKMLTRGKVEVRASVRAQHTGRLGTPNDAAVQSLLDAQSWALKHAKDAKPLSVADILRWPGVLADGGDGSVAERETALREALDEALNAHQSSRTREGAAMAAAILQRASQARALATAAIPAAQKVRAEFGPKLRAKIESAGVALDAERLAQEITLQAQRIDIEEEVDRLFAHLTEVERVLHQGGDVGKRLDFLMQELNREANTLGSKSAATETTLIAVELKVLIEQMREQVQNLQ